MSVLMWSCEKQRQQQQQMPPPPPLLKVYFCLRAPSTTATSPLPAAFCNIVHRFSKPISGDARASVNETCSKFQHGIAWFKSVKMHREDEGKTMFYERQASACAVLRDRCACDADV